MATYKNTSGDYIITANDGTGNLAVNANFNVVGDAAFTSANSVLIAAPQTTITGNLNVVGNVTYINVQDIRVDDPFITVAGNNNGTVETAAFQTQGLVTQTSANTFAGIRFDNANLAWQVSSSVDVTGAAIDEYSNVATSAGSYLIAAPTNVGTYTEPVWPEQGLIVRTSDSTYAALRFNNTTSKWEVSPGVTAAGDAIDPYLEVVSGPAEPQFAIQFNVNNVFSGSTSLTFDSDLSQLALTGYQAFNDIGGPPAAVANAVAVYHNIESAGGTGLYVKTETVEQELVSKSRAIVFGLIL